MSYLVRVIGFMVVNSSASILCSRLYLPLNIRFVVVFCFFSLLAGTGVVEDINLLSFFFNLFDAWTDIVVEILTGTKQAIAYVCWK